MDTLKPQPQGSWSPSVNINTLLLSIRLLLAHPNADDGLVPDITEEYKRAYHSYRAKAVEHTRKHGMQGNYNSSSSDVVEAIDVVETNKTGDAPVYPAISTAERSAVAVAVAGESAMDTDSGLPDSPASTSLQPPQSEADTMAEDSYAYCCDGYTLIGCNPSSLAYLQETLRLSSGATGTVQPAVAQKRPLDSLPSVSTAIPSQPPRKRR